MRKKQTTTVCGSTCGCTCVVIKTNTNEINSINNNSIQNMDDGSYGFNGQMWRLSFAEQCQQQHEQDEMGP